MNYNDIVKPIGLYEICSLIINNCSKSDVYKKCRIKPHHYIVNLDTGEGRTTLLEYITNMYKSFSVLDFKSGLDDYLEIVFDGSFNQFKEMKLKIESAAVFSEAYHGIIGIDATSLITHKSETQWTDYLTFIKKISKEANIIFFISTQPTKHDELYVNEIIKNISNVERVNLAPYSKNEYVDIAIRYIENKGVRIECANELNNLLLKEIQKEEIDTLNAVISIAEKFIFYADFSGFTPTISEKDLSKLVYKGERSK